MWRTAGLTSLCGLFVGVASASAQTPPTPLPPPPPLTLPGITVMSTKMDEERSSILPSLGATKYDFSRTAIQNTPQGQNAPLNQVLLRAPGVVQDGFGQIHVRGDHGSLQYRLDGVQLPEGLALFSQVLSPRFANSLSLLTGALPAQYGLRTAGVVDIGVKSGTANPGAELSFMGGSYNWVQPSAEYGGRSGNIDYFATGQYLSNSIGIENPFSAWTPIHDQTSQWYGLAKVTGIVDENTRLSFIGGGVNASYQIPNNINQVPNFTVFGNSTWDSSILDQRQWESTYFGIASLQKTYQDVNAQLSGFARYSQLNYQPDAIGDLLYNGVAPWAQRTSFAIGAQGDASWKVASRHTLRGGFLVQRERVTSFAQLNTLPFVPGAVDPDDPDAVPEPVLGDQPIGLTDFADLTGWTYSVYLQDEWKVLPTLTVNAGLRFDAITAPLNEYQFSPRVNVVWEPTPEISLRAGYARYFVPVPLNQVSAASIAARAGTAIAPEVMTNDPARAERSDNIDVGLTVKPLDGLTVGFSAFYKWAENYIDKGQFGAPIFQTAFNYSNAQVRGFELFANYDKGPWSLYANLAWSQVNSINITSSQFNFEQAELDYIASNWIFADHNQSWTGSAGAAYVFNMDSDYATRVSADVLYGNGLRQTIVTPNDTALPAYATLNLSVTQRLPINGSKGTNVRFDAINVTDGQYQLRTGTGVGVGAPQFGMRRAFFVTMSQKF
jgi:outer membrane receptor protein involved in Fe transport